MKFYIRAYKVFTTIIRIMLKRNITRVDKHNFIILKHNNKMIAMLGYEVTLSQLEKGYKLYNTNTLGSMYGDRYYPLLF